MLRNFWYLIVYLFIVVFVFSFYGRRYQIDFYGEKEERWPFLEAFIVFVPLIIWAGYRGLWYADTAAYKYMFEKAPSTLEGFWEYVSGQPKDPGYFAFMAIFKNIISDNYQLFFLLIALIQGLCLTHIYRNYSCNYLLTITMFVLSTDYIAWMHNGMRQFLGACLIFLTYPMIMKKHYVPAIVLTLLVSRLHATALIIIPFFFICQGKIWNSKTLIFALAVFVAVNNSGQFSELIVDVMEDTQYKAEITDFINSNGTNILRTLVYCVPAFMSFIFRKRIELQKNPEINYAINMTIISAGLYIISSFTSGVMVGRLPIAFSLYGYITLPWIIKTIFTERSVQYVIIIIIVLYMIFFYYQMHFVWGLM